ncbi:hypothetical protein D9758_005769 [Tetrapyrgos nigripes]|uniref:E2 ubiquitin-conjugating enzyme n=1 Tax=Tetrapyrgos nigripes TaxID=182062 RepID=A0A8H5GJF9_9AGAR|nr:hypothetical protein D9758_005769 [Tetrapyrgos nigripes]
MPPMPAGASTTTIKRIHREVADLKKEDMGAITLAPSEDNLFLWKGTIPGPEGSVYEGGVFNVEVQLSGDYPFTSPKVVFKTRIYHMNISDRGDICIDILKHNWSPALSLFKVMLSLSSLLTDPNPKDPLVSGIANQYITNRKLHDNTARQWTELYAKPKPPSSQSQNNTKSKGKQKATGSEGISASTNAAGGSRHTTVVVETITIDDDSDEETDTGKKKSRAPNGAGAGKKRKRESPAASSGRATRGSSSASVDVEDAEDDEDGDEIEVFDVAVASAASSSRKEASKPRGGTKGRRTAPRLDEDDEVIVIEDDD